MQKINIGIDCGSSACKGALLIDEQLAFTLIKPTSWNPKQTAYSVLEDLLKQANVTRQQVQVCVTGYGRVNIDFADKIVTEITCHALGAQHLLPGVKTIIDIGGQDSKVISVSNGKVQSFYMNDKCAAGTGRFLELSANRMEIDLLGFAELLKAGKLCSLSSMCAVFADSEIISLLAAGKSREEVAGGIVQSIITRVITLAAKIEVNPPVLLTGGLADLNGFATLLEQKLACSVAISPLSRFAGAIGAAQIFNKQLNWIHNICL